MIALLALAGIVAAHSNTYLECDTIENGHAKHYEVTLNEAEGIADWRDSMGGRRDPAQFSAGEVSYFDTTISRVDLSMERRYFGHVWRGQCQIAKPAKRAF